MKILQVSYTYYPFLEMGGPPAKVQAIAEGVAGRGHDVTVLTPNHWNFGPTKVCKMGGLEVIYLRSIARYRVVSLNPGVVPFCLRRLREFEVVHIYGLYELLGLAVRYFCRRWRIPYVLEPLGMFRPRIRSLAKKRLYHRIFGSTLVRDAERIIVTSEVERRQLMDDGLPESRIILRRNGIDLSQFEDLPPPGGFRRKVGIRPDEKIVLFMGRLAPIKSLDLLLEAFSMLPPDGNRLVLVGPPDPEAYMRGLQKTAERLKVADRVTFAGPLYGQAKLEALSDADVFALPSESESFGNAAAEALACGTPAVVTEGCGIAPYVADRAGLVVSHDAGALSEALRRLLTDSDLAGQYGRQGPHVAQGLRWDEPVAQMDDMYRRLSDNGIRRSGGRDEGPDSKRLQP